MSVGNGIVLATVSAAAAAAEVTVSTQTGIDWRNGIVFFLHVSSAAAAGGDTLVVIVDSRVDAANFTNIVRFNTIVGNATVLRDTLDIRQTIAAIPTGDYSAALVAAGIFRALGDLFRVRYTVTGVTALYSFRVIANPY